MLTRTDSTGKRFLVLVLMATCNFSTAKAEDFAKLDKLCKELGTRLIAPESKETSAFWQDRGAVFLFSFSPEIESCVGTKTDYLKNLWAIKDASENFIGGNADDPYHTGNFLFVCNEYGVQNVLLDVARRHRNEIFKMDRKLYADNGEGGLPASSQTPPAPYGRDKCAPFFKKKLVELRLLDPPQ